MGPATDTASPPGSGRLSGTDLHVGLDFPLPSEVAVGAGTAVFACGWCFCPKARIRSLAFVADGEVQPLANHGLPRADVHRANEGAPHSFRSGFWGIARIGPGRAEHELLLRAELADGSTVDVELGRLAGAGPVAAPVALEAPRTEPGPLVAICMAAWEPPLELFRRQLESIREQTHRNWLCVISDDCSRPARFEELVQAVGDDPRFVVDRSPVRRGFYGNFERALSLAPAEAELVCMADQDDLWHPDKLETLVARLGDAQLVYSDARLVTPAGELLAETYWGERRNNHSSMQSLLLANAVTGSASLFRRELLERALPFPPGQFEHYHDHWLALNALAAGEIAFVDRPLYDYVQHGGAVLGHAEANKVRTVLDRIRALGFAPRERVRRWRARYFVDYWRLVQFASVLELRCGDLLGRDERRVLRLFIRGERSPSAHARLAVRAVRELSGRPETLGAELALLLALLWRHLLGAMSWGLEEPAARLPFDARPPPRLARRPSRPGLDAPAVREAADKIAPLELAVRDDAPPRINLLIPSIDLDHLFGGYIAKFNLARRLAERGARVRVVTVDPVPPLPREWRARVESFSGLAGLLDRVEVVFGREAQAVEVSRSDRFIATTWWTAHIAHKAARALGGDRFLYLIQEYEPFTFPMGTFAALATESYRFRHDALFSTELLRDYFRRREIGVYADGAAAGDRASAAFQNAITPIEPPTVAGLSARERRRLLFYARPEKHAARNMFELGLLALSQAIEDGAFRSGWELSAVGTVGAGRRIELGGGATLDLLPRTGQESYARLLREHDVGLALMYTPHPSLVPLEMASAGMLTVTNSFENKTAEAMAAISPNLITVEPGVESLAAGLREAAERSADLEARVRGSGVDWSRDWGTSFDDDLMARVESFLQP
ncbi:MAG TPA: glycosyltransferase [Thermoleophilaceae bacterium]